MDMIQTKENREVKNSVFIDLFCYYRTAEAMLELIVRVININLEEQHEILENVQYLKNIVN